MVTACHLGPTPYAEGLRLQEALVNAIADRRTGDWLLFPDHAPVLTVGRGAAPGGLIAAPETLAARGIEIFHVARGGDITWHGPGQLVGYTVFDLARDRDLRQLLRGLEAALIDVLAGYGIESHAVKGRTGVWAGERKIASIGVAVRRWVAYHGFALNVAPDLRYFDLIHPCGLRDVRMTSIAELLGERAPALAEVRERAAEAVARRLTRGEVRWVPRAEAWGAARDAARETTMAVAAR
jgi:lipoate-protein ligase B